MHLRADDVRARQASTRHSDPILDVEGAYNDVIVALHNLARTLERAGSDNFATAARADGDAMQIRKTRNLMKLLAAENDNGEQDA